LIVPEARALFETFTRRLRCKSLPLDEPALPLEDEEYVREMVFTEACRASSAVALASAASLSLVCSRAAADAAVALASAASLSLVCSRAAAAAATLASSAASLILDCS